MNTVPATTDQLGVLHQDVATLGQRATTQRRRSTSRPPRQRTPMGRTIATIAATIAMLLGPVAAAQASGAGFDVRLIQEGLFYADFDKDILLFVGGTAEDFCNGDEPTHRARVFTRRDGSVDVKVDASKQTIYLYSSKLGGPELVDATCEAMFDDDPYTVPLEPFAEGEGRVRMRVQEAPDGNLHIVNSTVGAASSTDGTTWRVRGWADLMIEDGRPVGDPADFQGLRVNQTGR